VWDAARLGRRLREVEHSLRHGRHPGAARANMEALEREVEKAAAFAQARAAALPRPTFPAELPIVQRKEEIAAAIRGHQVVVVCGETGSGKSTQLPKICLELGRGTRGFIGHTQPRRIAARSVAERVAEELESPLGRLVGYKVRFTDRSNAECYIKVMTDGILLAETQQDRLLEKYDTLIIDEAHERSLNIDFLLGYLRTILPKRPDLKVIVTSATIDPKRFAVHFGGGAGERERGHGVPLMVGTPRGDISAASVGVVESSGTAVSLEGASGGPGEGVPIIEVSGRTYPVETRYRPLRSEDPDEADRTLEHGILDAVDELVEHDNALGSGGEPGDILVFLPGEREIRETAEELEQHHLAGGHGGQGGRGVRTEVLPLYARLSAEEQHRVFARRSGVRRIVLATNVAETSLTVPGIRYVIDTGLARISRYSSRSRVQGLPIEKISRASANQRSGRCGRVAPGVCIRLYSEEDFKEREEFTPPEIVRTNLANVILQMMSLRLGDVERFPFVEAPNPRAIQEGYDTLTELGAIDARFRLTSIGTAMARLPIDPRLARMILAAEREGCVPEVVVIAAALSVQDPRERSAETRDAADKVQKKFINAHIPARPVPTGPDGLPIPGVARARDDEPVSGSDFMVLVNIWNEFQRQRGELSSGRLRKWCKEHYLGYMRMREWVDVHSQLHRIVTEMRLGADSGVVRRSSAGSDGRSRGLGEAKSPAGSGAIPGKDPPGTGGLPAEEGRVHRALLTGLLVNVGRFEEQTREYAGTHGAKFSLFPGSAMFSAKAKWVMAGERVRTTKVYARTVARIRPEWIEELAPTLITRSYADTTWNERTGTAHVFETVFLFGLEVIPRRRANLAHVDPAAARSVFIQHALIDGKYAHQGRFYAANQALLNEAQRLEAKARRRDLTADLSRRFDFYDKRLPEKATSGGAFERWRMFVEKERPLLLHMRLEDLVRPGAVLPDPRDTPDVLVTRAGAFPLSYRFEPGEHDDGVTVTVPLAALSSVDAGQLEWLVPGWEREKITELLRAVPKEVRKALGPAAQVCRAFLESTASPVDRSRSLREQLAAFVSRTSGVKVGASVFDSAELQSHMTMRVLVTDARGRPIANGRDLVALRNQLRSQIAGSLASLRGTEFNRTGMRDWECGDIPERVDVDAGNTRVPAHPALFDEGKTVGMRLCDSPAAAAVMHHAGLRRLFALRVKGEIRAALDHAPGLQRLVGVWGPHGTTAALLDTLTLMVAQRVFLKDGAAEVRTFGGFTARIEEGFGSIVSASLDSVALATEVYETLHRVSLRMESMMGGRSPVEWAPALEGVRNQLMHLCPPGPTALLLSTPVSKLMLMPRYLRGVESRLLKIQQGKIVQDQQRAAELRPYLRRWLDAREGAAAMEPGKRSALEAYRWMLEEFRVTLFAQELRVPGPGGVTPKKLDEQWALFLEAV
jgi:ATP-dependent helicase HrpA